MTFFLSNRDGDGKTSEEGHYKFPTNAFSGNVLGATDLLVTQNSPVGMSVLILPGQYKIDTTGYSYTGWNTSSEPLVISTADPANARITTVVAYVDKQAPTAPSPPNNPGIVKLMAINGAPAPSPAAPSGSTIQTAVGAGNPYIVLANITVGAGVASITNAVITDLRVRIVIGSDLVGPNSIQASAVTTVKVADLAITGAKVADNTLGTAKIQDAAVTDVKWRNGIAFSARRTASKTFAASTWTKISANVADYNYGSGYVNSGEIGRFTAPVSGAYLFTVTMNTENAGQTRCITSFWKNGGEHTRVFDLTGSDINIAGGSAMIFLNAGDYIEAYGWMGASADIGHATRTHFGGALITRA